jgi:hypothetical protein
MSAMRLTQFLKRASLLVFFLTGVGTLSSPVSTFGQDLPPYEMLVVGDSHVSGQGLRQQNKFYFLVKEWLQNEVFGATRTVNLKVKAHAGSRISMHPEELAAMQKAGDDINKFHYAEANISSPTIRAQIDIARREYDNPDSVNLVMLSGCITDVLVADIINPFYPEKKLRERIRRFCGESMTGLLEHTRKTFPNARIVVVGYFPIVSRNSDIKTLARYFLKIISFPPKLQFFFTNILSRQFLKIFRNKMAKRSAIWLRESNREIREAVSKMNNGSDNSKVLFVESPITEEFSYGTKNSMFWEIGENHIPNDETYAERRAGCKPVFDEMKYQHYGRLSTRMCELSSVAHPNVTGSKAFAEAIKVKIESSYLIALRK